MFYVSEIQTTSPLQYQTPLQKQVYEALEELQIPFERVDTDEAVTMDDCVAIDEKLKIHMVKTLFLCSRRQTDFYLFVTTAQKPFRAGNFSSALGVSRVSFAPAPLLESMLGVKVGAATVLSSLIDRGGMVQVVLDRGVLAEEWYGCSDGTTTGYLKIRTSDILDKFLPFAGHTAAVIEV